MPRWPFVVLAVVASGTSVAAQMAEQEVAKVEQARMEARRKADSAMLARLSADDILIVGPGGQLIDKKGVTALTAVPKIAGRDARRSSWRRSRHYRHPGWSRPDRRSGAALFSRMAEAERTVDQCIWASHAHYHDTVAGRPGDGE